MARLVVCADVNLNISHDAVSWDWDCTIVLLSLCLKVAKHCFNSQPHQEGSRGSLWRWGRCDTWNAVKSDIFEAWTCLCRWFLSILSTGEAEQNPELTEDIWEQVTANSGQTTLGSVHLLWGMPQTDKQERGAIQYILQYSTEKLARVQTCSIRSFVVASLVASNSKAAPCSWCGPKSREWGNETIHGYDGDETSRKFPIKDQPV